jgi:hypothetical protein
MDLLPNVLNEHFIDDSDSDPTKLENKVYKAKYRDLKRTLRVAVSKNEYLKSELRHSQKKLQVTKCFEIT